MKSKLDKVATAHELDLTIYVAMPDVIGDPSSVTWSAGNDRLLLLDDLDEDEAVIGVYKLVGVERIKRKEHIWIEDLA